MYACYDVIWDFGGLINDLIILLYHTLDKKIQIFSEAGGQMGGEGTKKLKFKKSQNIKF